ncbi:MAG TPA: SusC/RagA family TonB-linked outer membrane protein [Chitinophagaceae bacterium]|nr:SusC/RagA family TonB-linked outer membrane protein [Chitinophagaceae bacterium]
MRKTFLFVYLFLLSLSPQLLMAQEQTVSGTVSSVTDNAPLIGVTIQVKGTNITTQTNTNGQFSIKAQTGQVLVFTYVGYNKREITIRNAAPLNIKMVLEDNTLSEVVVTALDIKKDPKELGFSAPKISGTEVAGTQRENFLNGLAGRVAGVTINSTGGQAGSSVSIVLRGFNSLALDNQPLFVVDGIILDNSTFNETSNSGSSLGLVENSTRNINQTSNRNSDYTNRIADINPNDIESITILKGPEAAALYGSQAGSGAIIITTKKGKNDGKLSVNYDNSFRISELNRFPEYSTNWSSGISNGVAANVFSHFGPAYAANVKKYDNIKEFFQTGFSQQHNLSVEFGKKNYSFRFSGSAFNQSGVIPENKYQKYSFRISNNTKLGKYVDITPAITYIRTTNDKPKRGGGGYLLNLLIWPANNDATDYLDVSGGKKLLYSLSPNSEIDNPFFSVKFNRGYDVSDRYIASFGININPFSWLTLSGRFGYDTYKADGWSFYHPLSSILTKGTGGQQDNYYSNYKGYNHTLSATAKKSIGKINLRLLGGTMWQDYRREVYSVFGTNFVDSVNSAGQLVKNNVVIAPDQINQWIGDSSATRVNTRLRLNNASKERGLANYTLNRQLAFFGEFSVNYNSLVFLTYSHRFENSSIFPKNFRNYNYPAGSLSAIVTDIFPFLKNGDILDYMKIRASLASTARVSAPYANQSVFNLITVSGGGYAYGFNNNNFLLEPEIQNTYEFGTELKLFRNKLGLDITYYNTLNKKQIVENFRLSYATGFVLNTLNVGSTRNRGIEITVEVSPLSKKDFNWYTRLSFNKTWNKVISLPPNVPEFYISDTWLFGNARGGLVTGGPTTGITSFGYQRNNKGDILIDPANGLPLVDQAFKIYGDRNPDFTLGWLNNLRYKNWSISFLWDLKIGGDIFNATEMYLTQQGLSKRTDDRYTARIIKGVLKDGLENSATPTVNTISVIPAYNSTYYTTRLPEEEFIEKNVNWFRLRDLTIRYNFPTNKIKSLPYVKSLGFFFTANDLILFTNYLGADPAINGNTAGTRGVGGWGFDYGNIAAPVNLNFGLRAGF